MNEIQLKYGCNPNQKPSRIFMEDGSDLPVTVLNGKPFDEPTSGLDYDSMVRVSKLIEQLSSSGVIVFVVSHDFEFIVRTCTEVVQLDDDGAIQNQRLSPEILKTLSEKYFT